METKQPKQIEDPLIRVQKLARKIEGLSFRSVALAKLTASYCNENKDVSSDMMCISDIQSDISKKIYKLTDEISHILYDIKSEKP